jgi:nitrous oxidase accessory protein NosD
MNARRLLSGTYLSVLCLAAASPAFALANRVFVSARSGNDTNSCSNILTPCQTFAGAVLQLNPGGDAIVLDSGGYGPVTITQALTIEAPAGVTAFIHSPSGDAITINAGASDTVVLRGLALNGGSGNGITVKTVGVLHVESCVINGFGSSGLFFGASGQLFVKDTVARGNFGVGIFLVPSSGIAKASIDHCRLEGNSIGWFSGNTSVATIRDSVAAGQSSDGFLCEGQGAELNIENCVSANNLWGIDALVSSLVRVSNSTVADNSVGLRVSNSSLLTRSNNTVEGNGTDGAFTGTFSAR